MRRFLFRLVTLLPLAACAQGPADNSRCVMDEVAHMAVLNEQGSPIVAVGINGTPVAFVVDTGGIVSLLGTEAARRMGLSADYQHSLSFTSLGGAFVAYPVTIREMDLGGASAQRATLMEAGPFGGELVGGLPLSGSFGADFLANYDVEFDLPAKHVSLYTEEACNAGFPQPWDGKVLRETFDLRNERAIMLRATLDGAKVQMQLDSGATSIVDLRTAFAAGVTVASVRGDLATTTRGVDGRRLATRLHRFGSLAVGPERLEKPLIRVANIVTGDLLGADFLRTHRVWISYAHRVMWVQPVGPGHLAEPALPRRPRPAPDVHGQG